ncbi:MAG: tail fiber protein [Chitinophagaceae bacterium]
MDALIGEIRAFPFGYTPEGWAACNGQTLTILDNQYLYSVIGTTFGGDGKTNFAVPNLQGRTLAGIGTPAKDYHYVGYTAGTPAVELHTSQLPIHSHIFNTLCTSDPEKAPANEVSVPTSNTYLSNVYEVPPPTTKRMGNFYTTEKLSGALNASAVSSFGRGGSHPNMQPYLAINYCICLDGDMPQRS